MTLSSPRLAFWLLIFVCFVWGALFVLVSEAISLLSTHTFNALRFSLAALALLPLCWWQQRQSLGDALPWIKLLPQGMLLGFFLFLGFACQTEGLRYTSVSNAGFITGLSVSLVPLLSVLFFASRLKPIIWISVALATAGLYLLTIGDKLEFNAGDALILACAFCFAIHILLTGHLAKHLPALPLTVIQLAAVAVYSAITRWGEIRFFDTPTDLLREPWFELIDEPVIIVALLVASLFGSSLAYWAQTSCQKLLSPSRVALIFASEPLFAHATAAIVLAESLGTKGWIGASLIIAAMLAAELGDDNHPTSLNSIDQTSAPSGY